MNPYIGKQEILETLKNKHRLTHPESNAAVNSILNTIIDTLANDVNVEIRGFGSFQIKKYNAQVQRNPRTGEPVNVDTQYHAHSKPGEPLRKKVNQYVRKSL